MATKKRVWRCRRCHGEIGELLPNGRMRLKDGTVVSRVVLTHTCGLLLSWSQPRMMPRVSKVIRRITGELPG